MESRLKMRCGFRLFGLSTSQVLNFVDGQSHRDIAFCSGGWLLPPWSKGFDQVSRYGSMIWIRILRSTELGDGEAGTV